MAVCVGDDQAKNFQNKTHPLPLGPKGNQLWTSLFVKDPATVIAVMNTAVDGKRGIWAIDGKVVPLVR
ncbi:MAG TPA: hypothetical protein VF669_22385 [Tepidisphaeraceae bacterium]|jgi:hypothetical protein